MSLVIGSKLVGMCLKSGSIATVALVPVTALVRCPSGAVGVTERLYLVVGIAAVATNAGMCGVSTLGAGG